MFIALPLASLACFCSLAASLNFMANKNQKRIRELFRKTVSTTKPESPGTIQVPAGGYHNETKGRFTTRLIERSGFTHKRKARPFPIPDRKSVV